MSYAYEHPHGEKPHSIGCKFSAREFAQIQSAAAREGLSVYAWIKRLALAQVSERANISTRRTARQVSPRADLGGQPRSDRWSVR